MDHTLTITVSALVILHPDRPQVLMVRKKGTSAFMLPGGKLEAGETSRQTVIREIAEELQADVDTPQLEYLGTFTAPAANEGGALVEGHVFTYRGIPAGLDIGEVAVHEEIAEARWVDIAPVTPDTAERQIAPLTRDCVVPNLPAWVAESYQGRGR